MTRMLAVTYKDLEPILLGSRNKTRVIGRNVKAELDSDAWEITIRYHGHPIVRINADEEVWFSLAGWPTVTTRERINHFTKGRLYQKDNVQYYEREALDSEDWYYDYA